MRNQTRYLVAATVAFMLSAGGALAQSEDRTALLKKQREKTTQVEHELEQSFTVDLSVAQPPPPCRGQIQLEYDQYDTVARVDAELTGESCVIESFTYTLVVRVRDENYDVASVNHAIQWSADQAQQSLGSGDYPIGSDVDLVDVRARQFSCDCKRDDVNETD
ncbi:MAG: hypothetical protein AAFZ58_09970 [Pseudomonadota bacterium]